ncbi:hypothetical protein ACTPOK_36970 [Streptomyces inhibens]|uniref:hypothetical protein n=1 Tax=Streptomyces inhibens TaxID=2293571 RepID=UPI00402A7719
MPAQRRNCRTPAPAADFRAVREAARQLVRLLDDPELTTQGRTLRDIAAVEEQALSEPWSGVPTRGRSPRSARGRLGGPR